MNFAIFWLPIIGGILLGGIAGTAWYGGNKVAGLWLGFAGVVCFLLLAVLQIQQSIRKPDQASLAFRVESLTVIPESLARMLWHKPDTDTIHPVRQAMYLSITNLQPLGSTIEGYRLEWSRSRSGPWKSIGLVPTGAEIFWEYNSNHAKSIDLNACDLASHLMEHSLTPGNRVAGWIWITDNSPLEFSRIVLDTDTAGISIIPIVHPHIERNDVNLLWSKVTILRDVSLSGMRYAD